jgi:hypothetical protein
LSTETEENGYPSAVRQVGLGRLVQDVAVQRGRRQHEAVDVPGPHLVEDHPFARCVAVGVADQRDVAVLGEPVLEAAHDRREQRVVQVGDEHAHGVRAPGAQ